MRMVMRGVKLLKRSGLEALFAIFFLLLLAACGPAPAPESPRHDEARHEEPRHDEARREEPGRDEPRRHESKSERRRRREEREGSNPSAESHHSETAPRQQTTSSGQTHDLSADEAQGGHTLSRHVGRSDADLQERLESEGNISAASTYTDRAAAEAVVGKVLEHNSRVEEWEQRGGRRPNLALDYHGNSAEPIGRCMQRGSSAAVPAWDAIVVLKASREGAGFYVLTTYPECPR